MKIAAALVLIVSSVSFSQVTHTNVPPDSQYSFMPIRDLAPDTLERRTALGLDLMIGNSGFGAGIFYKQGITGTLSWTLSWSFSEAKAPNEVDYIDPFTGQKFVPGKINQLFVFPLMVGLQYRLFKNQLTNSFRPFIFAGVGPNAVLASPYDQPLSWSLSHSHSHYGLGAYFGTGAYFGLDPNSLMGVSLRYYILPMSHGIESMQNEPMANFNSFFIAFNIATQY